MLNKKTNPSAHFVQIASSHTLILYRFIDFIKPQERIAGGKRFLFLSCGVPESSAIFVWIILIQETMNMVYMIGTTELLVIGLVILLFFGGRKIPELMKGLGKGVKSFKDGMNGVEEELKDDSGKKEK